MRFEYLPGTTLLHRLDVRAKLWVFLGFMIATFLFGHWAPNAVLTAIAGSLLLWSGVGVRRILGVLAPLSFIVVLVVIFAAYGYRPSGGESDALNTVIFSFPEDVLPLTVAGLYYGISLGFRILTMVMLTTLLLLVTPIDDFVAAMRQAHIPHFIVFIVMTALRFIPTMQHRADQVLDAQRARGARIDRGGLISRVRAYIPIMVPLLTSGIRMSDDLAAAMINRGYGATKRPTALLTLRASPVDFVVVALAFLALGSLVWLRIIGLWTL
ncbi:energy-coupling factor transporter transmembrane component T [Salinibacterium amurskyense]|uniref:energy-coupling factor transporter transmembrane component T family protein n=1 Tax=Salinibacterium amurskyense TaxID=205941 RepID=UPI00311F27D1